MMDPMSMPAFICFHNSRSIDGLMIILVLNTSVPAWREEIRDVVDLKKLGVQLIVAQTDNADDLFKYPDRTTNPIRPLINSVFAVMGRDFELGKGLIF